MTNRTLSAISTAASRSFITAYVTTMRPYLLFVSGITGIAGMSFLPEIPVSQFVLVFIASFLSYGFGQALTDCFQIDTDSLSAPYRPLTQGIILRTDVLRMSAAGLLVCIFIFALYNYMNLVVGLMCGIAGIEPATIANSASYIDHWRKKISKDPKLVVIAASQAQKAADYIQNIAADIENEHGTAEIAEQPVE